VAVISVVIVDDEALVRYGFELILGAAPDIEVVATTSDVDAIAAVTAQRPDVVLLDVRMPRIDGLDLLGTITALPEPPAVAMLTTFDAAEHLGRAMELGAAGFLLKDTDPEGLAQYVRVLAAGGIVLASELDRARLFAPSVATTQVPPMSDRERAVLQLVADGVSNPEIGTRLGVSTGTVKEDVRTLLAAFGVTSRVQLALRAAAAGLLRA
jgi:DNA-binding NarL/FixJ family response regulator